MYKTVNLGLSSLVFVIFAAAAVQSIGFTPGGRWLPLIASIAGAVFALASIMTELVSGARAKARAGTGSQDEAARTPTEESARRDVVLNEDVRSALYWLAWFIGFAVLLVLLGAFVAAPLWLGLFLKINSDKSWLVSLLCMGAIAVFLYGFSTYLPIQIPQGALF